MCRKVTRVRASFSEPKTDEAGDDKESPVGDDGPDDERLQSHWGPFTVPTGYSLVDKPAETQEAWDALCSKSSWWRNKRLAHLWDDGWDTSTFKRKFGGRLEEGAPDRYLFFYIADRTECTHTLPIDKYGAARTWVVISK